MVIDKMTCIVKIVNRIGSPIMKKGRIVSTNSDLKHILESAKTIAIVGLSANPSKDSNKVARYLKENGFKIIPVHPKEEEILGEKAVSSLDEISEPVDIVNVFRRPEQIVPHAEEAIRNGAGVFWMQLGIENQEAAELLNEAGVDVVMNRCTKVDYESFFKKSILV